MNASKITVAYVGAHFMTMKLHKLYTPELVRLMVHWVYVTHNDFLEEYYGMFDEDGEWDSHVTTDQIKAINAKQMKMSKEFKRAFPHIKQQNVMYEKIMEILKQIILEELD